MERKTALGKLLFTDLPGWLFYGLAFDSTMLYFLFWGLLDTIFYIFPFYLIYSPYFNPFKSTLYALENVYMLNQNWRLDRHASELPQYNKLRSTCTYERPKPNSM